MITISLCMIVKNEDAVLSRCLDSVKDAVDEIIIVDTGSDDSTKEIASGYTEKIFDFEWIQDFSAARNFAFSKATMDYQMWLDADDVIPADEARKLIELKHTMPSEIDMVSMKYHVHFDTAGNPVHITTRERLMRRGMNCLWRDPVHEFIPLSGILLQSDIFIEHRKPKNKNISTRNLNIYSRLEESGAPLTPRQQYYFARELYEHNMLHKAAYYFERFISEGKGWSEDVIAACHCLGICYKKLGDYEKQIEALLKAFRYAAPRAEICCEIGYCFNARGDVKAALSWFEIAAGLGKPESIGFLLMDYWGYIPNIEACVCCCELGDYDRAEKFNEAAAAFKPDSEAVLKNRAFLSAL